MTTLSRTDLKIITGILREVDPQLALDGIDVTDDFETEIEGLD